MQVASANESVTVTAESVHADAEAINRERTAENIVQVMPAEIITSLPNANVADAIGRLPGVSLERDEGEGKYVQIRGTQPYYNNVTIDGVNVPAPEAGVRQIKLDTIGSDLVESVEVNKTLLANMDADGIGGSVNLRTKTAGDLPMISLYRLRRYTPNSERTPRWTNSAGPSASALGKTNGWASSSEARMTGTAEESMTWSRRRRPFNAIPATCGNVPAQLPRTSEPTTREDIRLYTYYRTRLWFQRRRRLQVGRQFQHLYPRSLLAFPKLGRSLGDDSDHQQLHRHRHSRAAWMATQSYNASIRRPLDVIGSMVAGGQHNFSDSNFNWNISASRSAEDQHGYSGANFLPGPNSPLNAVQYAVDRSDPYRPHVHCSKRGQHLRQHPVSASELRHRS